MRLPQIVLSLAVIFFLLQGIFTSRAEANLPALPHYPTKHFETDGIFSGGSELHTALQSVSLTTLPKESVEKWAIDFTALNALGAADLPHYQLRYLHGDATLAEETSAHYPRFVFVFEGLEKNRLGKDAVVALIRRSRFVRDILSYPPIEEGDTAVEFILKQEVAFDAYQPRDWSSRLVLEIKPISTK